MTASEDTEVLFLNIGKVLTTCTNACPFHAKLIQNLLTVCAAKNLQLSQRILHTAPKGIRARLMSYFSECVKRAGQYSFDIPYNRQQLADYLGVDRSAMCSELSRMQREGLLRAERSDFTLHLGELGGHRAAVDRQEVRQLLAVKRDGKMRAARPHCLRRKIGQQPPTHTFWCGAPDALGERQVFLHRK